MESQTLNRIVAANITAAITKANRSEASVARDTGIALTSLRRNLAGLNGASFTVANLAVIADVLDVEVLSFFTPQVSA